MASKNRHRDHLNAGHCIDVCFDEIDLQCVTQRPQNNQIAPIRRWNFGSY